MKIEQITSKTFIHTQNTMRDSDGHGHPGPETKGKSSLLTIKTDSGHEGHIVASPSDVQDTLCNPERVHKQTYGEVCDSHRSNERI